MTTVETVCEACGQSLGTVPPEVRIHTECAAKPALDLLQELVSEIDTALWQGRGFIFSKSRLLEAGVLLAKVAK